MILAALIDLGASAGALSQEIARFPIGEFSLEAQPASSRHIRGLRVDVRLPKHAHGHEQRAHHTHHAHGRTFKDIREMIAQSALATPVKNSSIAVFECIAKAEGRIHGVETDDVHFHEIGAVDSIVDIAGACLALHLLGVEGVSVGPLPLGRGIIHCAHGDYPSPAPATMEILEGMRTTPADEPFELVTPTGAALLKIWSNRDERPDGGRVVRTGYGVGHQELNNRPNILRATLFETEEAISSSDGCLVLECNIDDSTPEVLGALCVQLMGAGALDVFTTAVQMKKQRPGVLLTVLCAPSQREPLLDLIFRESTTFGIREYAVKRTVLERKMLQVATPYGPVHVKAGAWKGQEITRAPEMDECIALARLNNVAARVVYAAASEAASRL